MSLVALWLDVMNPNVDRDADGGAWYVGNYEQRHWRDGELDGPAESSRVLPTPRTSGSSTERAQGQYIAVGRAELESDNIVSYDWSADLTGALGTDPISYADLQRIGHGPLTANANAVSLLLAWLSRRGIDVPASLDPEEVQLLQVVRSERAATLVARDEQQQFRARLLDRDGRCILSGTTTRAALEAAHITPAVEARDEAGMPLGGPDTLDNGLTLRADLHRLFDRGLLVVDGFGAARFAPEVVDQGDYLELDGRAIDVGPGVQPHPDRLAAHRRAAAWFGDAGFP